MHKSDIVNYENLVFIAFLITIATSFSSFSFFGGGWWQNYGSAIIILVVIIGLIVAVMLKQGPADRATH